MTLDQWAWVSLLWLVLCAVALWSKVEVLGRQGSTPTSRKNALHRILGYLFVALYLVFLPGMFIRLDRFGPPQGFWIGLHAYLGLTILGLLLIKILVVRRYKKYMTFLPGLGATILTASLVLVGMSGLWRVGARLLSPSTTVTYQGQPYRTSSLLGKKVIFLKCARCHGLIQVYLFGRPEAAWDRYVKRMQEKDPAFLTNEDCANALTFLTAFSGEAKTDAPSLKARRGHL